MSKQHVKRIGLRTRSLKGLRRKGQRLLAKGPKKTPHWSRLPKGLTVIDSGEPSVSYANTLPTSSVEEILAIIKGEYHERRVRQHDTGTVQLQSGSAARVAEAVRRRNSEEAAKWGRLGQAAAERDREAEAAAAGDEEGGDATVAGTGEREG
jgi:hypothetical protein